VKDVSNTKQDGRYKIGDKSYSSIDRAVSAARSKALKTGEAVVVTMQELGHTGTCRVSVESRTVKTT
jgi:hypothetical protein